MRKKALAKVFSVLVLKQKNFFNKYDNRKKTEFIVLLVESEHHEILNSFKIKSRIKQLRYCFMRI